MPIEADVEFLNIDLILAGRFDREPLLDAIDDGVFVLHGDAVFGKFRKCLLLEVADPGLDLPRTLARLLRWVEELPPRARRSWDAASRRVFDIGIQSGLRPHDTHWTIRQEQIAALAKIGGEIALTVYGARRTDRGAASRPATGPRDT